MEEIAKQHAVEALRLSRERILQQIDATTNPRYRTTLESALADLDHKLSSQNDLEV